INSHFQSSEMTWTSSGVTAASIGRGGSSSWELIQAMPPRKMITSAGIDQTIISIRPEYSHSGRYRSRGLLARNHQAKPIVSKITGMTTASMIAVASNRIRSSALPIGPRGSKTPSLHDASRTVTPVSADARRIFVVTARMTVLRFRIAASVGALPDVAWANLGEARRPALSPNWGDRRRRDGG